MLRHMNSFEDAMPVYRPDDNEHMGYVADIDGTWHALTMFGCPFAEAATEAEARRLVMEHGLSILAEKWEYYDPADKAWRRCVIIEASPASVRVAALTDLEHDYLIANPGERTIRVSK